MGKYDHLPLSSAGAMSVPYTGRILLDNPFYNKGTAFTHDERREFGLFGLLPANIQTLEQQAARAYQQYSAQKDNISKNGFMTSMADQNTVLYYKLIKDHLKEMFSIIYTPTEGDAIENYSRAFRRSDGCFLNVDDVDQVEERMARFLVEGEPDGGIDYIVVSDSEEILGIGDQGTGGILISIAKLVLTTVCAGIHPDRTLAVVLDTGTNNEKLLEDELYLGLKQPRVRGERYDELVQRFFETSRKLFPKAFIHFEDFGVTNARRLLDHYRDKWAVFNDDVQGTGCITLAAIMAGLKISNIDITEARMVVFGTGSAGNGIAEQVAAAIATESGKSKEDAMKHVWCVDKQGLLLDNMGDELNVAQKPFARVAAEWDNKNTRSLQAVIAKVKPHILIGTSTQPGAFTKEIVQEMAKHVERPLIFPLSNPTRLHEAVPADLYEWTQGKALVATGSPFPPVQYDGEEYEVAECNNSVCFPGIGLGCVLSKSKLLTDRMLVAAVTALGDQAPALKDPKKGLVPDVDAARPVSVKIAKGVIRAAQAEGHAQAEDIPEDDGDLEEWVKAQMWLPEYRMYRKGGQETKQYDE